jgi:hypothetical protein
MGINKFGIGSLVIGLVLLFIAWFLKFSTSSVMHILGYLFYGGMLWIGLFLVLIGILMSVL